MNFLYDKDILLDKIVLNIIPWTQEDLLLG